MEDDVKARQTPSDDEWRVVESNGGRCVRVRAGFSTVALVSAGIHRTERALLIAAAPKLLEAARYLVANLETAMKAELKEFEFQEGYDDVELTEDGSYKLSDARAAIAGALGDPSRSIRSRSMTTDTPKRLSDADKLALDTLTNQCGCGLIPCPSAEVQLAALKQVGLFLSTPPSQDKVERARSLFNVYCSDYVWSSEREQRILAAITQALSEGSGQGGAEAMREAAREAVSAFAKEQPEAEGAPSSDDSEYGFEWNFGDGSTLWFDIEPDHPTGCGFGIYWRRGDQKSGRGKETHHLRALPLPSIEKEVEPSEAQVEAALNEYHKEGWRELCDVQQQEELTAEMRRTLKAALSHNQTGKEKGE